MAMNEDSSQLAYFLLGGAQTYNLGICSLGVFHISALQWVHSQ